MSHENRDHLVDAVVLPAFEEDHEAVHLTRAPVADEPGDRLLMIVIGRNQTGA